MTSQTFLELDALIASLDHLIPQLNDFVHQINNLQIQHDVKLVSNLAGDLQLDVPINMSQSVEKFLETKLGILDRLRNTHGQSISELLDKGRFLEQQLKLENPRYTTRLSGQIAEFARLNGAFN